MALSLQQFKDRERISPDWVIDGLLKRQNTGIMLGQPKKAAKSWLLLAMCWDLSEGRPVWGIHSDGKPVLVPPRPMRCVYFTQEDSDDDAHDRLEAHFSIQRPVNDRLWVVPKNLNIKFDTMAGRAIIQKELDDVKEKAGAIDLVVFDPLRRMHNGDENDSATIAQVWDVLDRVHKRYNCSTVIAHHTVKPPFDKSGYDPTDPFTGRGSGDIYGGGDAFMVVVPGAGNRDYRRVAMHFETKRGRGLLPAQLKVHFKTGQVEYLGTGWEQSKNADVSL